MSTVDTKELCPDLFIFILFSSVFTYVLLNFAHKDMRLCVCVLVCMCVCVHVILLLVCWRSRDSQPFPLQDKLRAYSD